MKIFHYLYYHDWHLIILMATKTRKNVLIGSSRICFSQGWTIINILNYFIVKGTEMMSYYVKTNTNDTT